MKLVYKRILIFFSVALNIGFLAAALYQNFDRGLPKHERRWQELMTILETLDLPAGKKAEVTGLMAGFRKDMAVLDTQGRHIRKQSMELMAQPGPLERQRLHGLFQDSARHSIRKKKRFEAHVLKMREVLGDEKGAEFFSRLRDHIQSRRKPPRS